MVTVNLNKQTSSRKETKAAAPPVAEDHLYRRHPLCWVPPITPGLMLAHVFCAQIAIIMVKAALASQSKEAALAFYGVYHSQPLNQLIHFVGVPGIIFSLMVFQMHLPLFSSSNYLLLTLELPFVPKHYPTWATLCAAFYIAYYFSIDPVGAALYLPALYGMYAVAARWTHNDRLHAFATRNDSTSWMGTGRVLQMALYIHVACWYTQIHWGHKLIEGGQPAVMQSLGGALTSAPLFAFYEGVWACGFRKELQQQVLTLVDQYTRELCQSGAVVMRNCDKI